MNHGVIEQLGTPEQVPRTGQSPVADFVGRVNVIPRRRRAGQLRIGHQLPVPAAGAPTSGRSRSTCGPKTWWPTAPGDNNRFDARREDRSSWVHCLAACSPQLSDQRLLTVYLSPNATCPRASLARRPGSSKLLPERIKVYSTRRHVHVPVLRPQRRSDSGRPLERPHVPRCWWWLVALIAFSRSRSPPSRRRRSDAERASSALANFVAYARTPIAGQPVEQPVGLRAGHGHHRALAFTFACTHALACRSNGFVARHHAHPLLAPSLLSAISFSSTGSGNQGVLRGWLRSPWASPIYGAPGIVIDERFAVFPCMR